MKPPIHDVRFTPNNGHSRLRLECPLSAKSRQANWNLTPYLWNSCPAEECSILTRPPTPVRGYSDLLSDRLILRSPPRAMPQLRRPRFFQISGVSNMRKTFSAAVSLALLGLLISSPVLAQTKTAKACKEEWKANKADNQAKGITEKTYVTQCRTGAAAAQPSTPPATATTAPPPKQDTSTKPATAPVVAAPAAKQQLAPRATPSSTSAPAGNTEFSTEAQAKGHCPGDTVVWANLKSKIYHFTGNKIYGATKNGAYMCEKESMVGGFRAAKNEKHP